MFGLPPKHTHKVSYDAHHTELLPLIYDLLITLNYSIDECDNHYLLAQKRYPISFFSLFICTRPKLTIFIRISSEGKTVIDFTYDYNSMFGIAIHDRGRIEKELHEVLTGIRIKGIRNLH